MPWTRELTDYPHVKKKLGEQKYLWESAVFFWGGNRRFQGRLEYVNPVNPGSNGRRNCSRTSALVKVVDPTKKKKNSNRRGKIEIEE